MEGISGELKLAESKKESLCKAYERLQSELSSFLSFTLLWKDLEGHLDGMRVSLERRAEELREGERSLAERARDVASREEGVRSALRRVEEREEEVRRKEMDLRSAEERLEKCREERRMEERELVATRKALRECISLKRDKKKELSSLEQLAEKCRRDYDSKKEVVEALRRELDSKEKKVRVVQSLLVKNARELDVKVEELGSVKRSLDECSRSVKSTREELSTVQSLLDQSLKAHHESEKRLSILDRTIEERDKEVLAKARKLQSLNDCQVEHKEKEGELKRICKSIEERSKEIGIKESQLHSVNILTEEQKGELKSKKEEAEEINRLINERLAELALKDSELESIKTSIGNLSKKLKSKEGELENMTNWVKRCNVQCMELELGRQQLDSIAKSFKKCSREMESRERTTVHSGVVAQKWKHPLTNGPVLASCQNSQCTIACQESHQVLGSSAVPPGSFGSIQQWQIKTEKPENYAAHNGDDSSVEYPPSPTILAINDSQLFQTELELSNENVMICKEISHTLQNSSDPAKLVLDVIEGSYTQYSNTEDVNSQTVVMRSQIVMLEQLLRISPSITHEVKEGAMKLAREWKVRLTEKAEGSLEVFSFLHFLAAFKLVSSFNENEILNLADRVSLNDNAPLLCQTLGLANRVTAPASTPASFSGVHLQPPREKKRIASDPAIDQQSQQHARKCRYVMKNPVRPV